MKKPNFFIVGAPKCGTTSMCEYLESHPDVFISTIKEPFFFCDDVPNNKLTPTMERYLELFEGANENHVAVGEGTTLYLYSPAAIDNIRAFDPNAKIIVMLRNPKHMVVSLHQQWVRALFEDERDFKKAWNLQSERSKGKSIPKHCRAPEWILYGNMGSYASYIERILKTFPADNVKVIIFDDFCDNTEKVFNETLEFLGLRRIDKKSFPVINSQKDFSSGFTQYIAQSTPAWVRNMVTRIRFSNHFNWIAKLLDFIFITTAKKRFTYKDIQDNDFKNELSDYFKNDIERLSIILNRNLNDIWK